MSARLEQRYRRLLLAYPAAYRQAFGDEMLGVAMSGADPGRDRPTVREAADLIGSGIRRRIGSAGQPQWRPGLSFVNTGLIVLNAIASINWLVAMLPEKRILGLVLGASAVGPPAPVRRFRTALYPLISGVGMFVVTEAGESLGATPALTAAASVTVTVAVLAVILTRPRNRAVSRTALMVATYLSVVLVSQRAYDNLYPASGLSVAIHLMSVVAVPVTGFAAGTLLIRRRERRTDVAVTGAV